MSKATRAPDPVVIGIVNVGKSGFVVVVHYRKIVPAACALLLYNSYSSELRVLLYVRAANEQ